MVVRERGTVVPICPVYASRHCILISTQENQADLVEKTSIVVVLPAHMLWLSIFRLLQHFHASLAQLLLHSLRHFCPQVVCEI
jgi:hypothetical protein